MARTVTLIGANGTEHVLACGGTGPYHLGTNSQLWGGTSHALVTRQVANQPGVRLEAVQYRSRTFAVPVALEATTDLETDTRIQALASVLSPDADVIVRYERDDGTTREITARLKSGFEQLNARRDFHWLPVVPLIFEAPFPFWRDTAENIRTITEVWDNGLFGGSNPVEVTNNGDVPVWPEFVIRGFSENVMATNLVTGQVWRVVREIGLTDVLRIVTDPANRAVYINDQLDWSAMDDFIQFWPIVPRLNHLILRGVGPNSTDLGSFEMRWRELYQTC